MLLETLAGAVVGLVVLWLLFEPLLFPERAFRPDLIEPEDPDETPRGRALLALKEIEFDRETGKLSDEDYAGLKARYTAAAVELLREEGAEELAAEPPADAPAPPDDDQLEAMIQARAKVLSQGAVGGEGHPVCPSCGPRPEADALYCSNCGRALGALAA